jgi:hypothetical protein
VNFAAITLCVASVRVFVFVVVCFVIDSVWKISDTPSYEAAKPTFTQKYLKRGFNLQFWVSIFSNDDGIASLLRI